MGLTPSEVTDKVLTIHKDIAKLLNVSEDYVKHLILDVFQIDIKDLLDFTLCNLGKTILYKEKALHKIVYKGYQPKKIFYNVYIIQDHYAHVRMDRVIRFILEEKYPHIFKNPKFYITKSICENEDSLYKIKPSTLLRDIDITTRSELSVQNLIDFICNDKRTKQYSRLIFYYIEKQYLSIYLKTDDEHISLSIPIEALEKNDWSIIENFEVYNVPCHPKEEKRWYSGKQKDAPYFNHPLFNELKKIFLCSEK